MQFTGSIEVEVVQYDSKGCPYRARLKNGRHRGSGVHLAYVTGRAVAALGIVFAHYDLDIGQTTMPDEARIVWDAAAKMIWQKFPGYTILLDPPEREKDSPCWVIEARVPLVQKVQPARAKQQRLPLPKRAR